MCEYRYCGDPIPPDRARYSKTKYCCRPCGLKEAALKRAEQKPIKRAKKAGVHHLKHPDFYTELLKASRIELENTGTIEFRLRWEKTKIKTKIGANDHYMVWYKQNLEKDES